ncbi:MAG: hypothetical protein KY469_13675 [Actinobacteria bacterium]|nr:hypothetical protein [Actinomycetota bacterium]
MCAMIKRIYDLAAQQHQVVHVRQAANEGIDLRSFRARMSADGGTRLQRGSWLMPGAERSFQAEAMAAVLTAGDRSAITGQSALYLHGITDARPSQLQVAVPADRARPTLVGVDDIIRSAKLLQRDVQSARGIRALVPAWSLLHSGRRNPGPVVLEWTINAQQRGHLPRGALEDVLWRCGHANGTGSVRRAYEATISDTVDSVLELDSRRLVRSLGHAPYPSPFPFLCGDGRVIHLDLPFPSIWFAYECDSPQSRAGGRAFRTDRKRWVEAKKGGWDVSWLTRDRIENDVESIAEELAAAHAGADPERPPPIATPCRQRRCRVCPELRASLKR